MSKGLCLIALIVALGLLLVFGLDLAMGIPFRKANTTMDIGFVVSSLLLAFASWTSFREQR